METVDIIFIVLAAIFGVAIMALLALSGIISKIDVRLKQNSNTDADKDITVVYNWIGWGIPVSILCFFTALFSYFLM